MLSNKRIKKAVATAGDIWLTDDYGGRGAGRLLLRINKRGTRRFYYRYPLDGRRVTMPMGEYCEEPTEGRLTIDEARRKALHFAAIHRDPATRDIKRIINPSAGHKSAPTTVPATENTKPYSKSAHTLLDLCNSYLDELKRRSAQSFISSASVVRVHIAPTEWAHIPAKEFTSQQVTALVRKVVLAGKKTTANKVRSLIHSAYQLAFSANLNPAAHASMTDFGITTNPVTATKAINSQLKPRDRFLDKLELGHLWVELTLPKNDFCLAVRLIRLSCLIGGQRCQQIAKCKTLSVDLSARTITILDPKGNRAENPRIHMLPLSAKAMIEVEWLLSHSQTVGSEFLFPGRTRGTSLTGGPVSNFLLDLNTRLVSEGKFKSKFLYANLRSTVETHMAKLKISKEVRGQIQSHGLGGIQTRHYDRYDYFDEKIDALLKWETFLEECKAEAVEELSLR